MLFFFINVKTYSSWNSTEKNTNKKSHYRALKNNYLKFLHKNFSTFFVLFFFSLSERISSPAGKDSSSSLRGWDLLIESSKNLWWPNFCFPNPFSRFTKDLRNPFPTLGWSLLSAFYTLKLHKNRVLWKPSLNKVDYSTEDNNSLIYFLSKERYSVHMRHVIIMFICSVYGQASINVSLFSQHQCSIWSRKWKNS